MKLKKLKPQRNDSIEEDCPTLVRTIVEKLIIPYDAQSSITETMKYRNNRITRISHF